jgi:hypothetical protein
MLVNEVLRDHGVGLGRYKANSLIRNLNLSNPILTLKKNLETTYSNIQPEFFLIDSNDSYIYFTSDSSQRVLEKRSYLDGSVIWSSNVGEFIYDGTLDSQGNIWIITTSKVRKYTPSGSYTDYTENGGGRQIHVDSSDNVYVVSVYKTFSITKSGSNRWTYSYANAGASTSSIMGTDGLYVFIPYERNIYKFGFSGYLSINKKNQSSIPDNVKGVATKNGTLFLSKGSYMGKWDKNLNSLTTIEPSGGYYSSTNIIKDKNDNLYIGFGNVNGYLAALNDDLSLRATVKLNHSIASNTINIDNNGYIIVSDGSSIKSYDIAFTILG